MKITDLRHRLLISTIIGSAFGLAVPAQAQDAPAADRAPAAAMDSAAESGDIVVTGTLFARRTDRETASPVTTLSAETLEQRGLTTVSDAIRSISADNSGSIPTAFSNGFAAGGSGVSLRGLGINSTLVLFDGLRVMITVDTRNALYVNVFCREIECRWSVPTLDDSNTDSRWQV